MEARAKLLGHAIHQMLIPFPLGLLSTAVIFDLVHLVTGTGMWATVSYWMIAAGVIGGLAAAVFGAIDWTALPRDTRAKRVATLHGVGNVIVVLLFSVSWLLRRADASDPGVLPILVALAGAGVSLYTAWLGGELVARMGVAVDDGAHLDAPSSMSGRPAGENARSGA